MNLPPEIARPSAGVVAAMSCGAPLLEGGDVIGRFSAILCDRDGNLLWREDFDNVVCTLGKNLAFNTTFSGSAYSVTGPFLGLISSASFTAVAAADTMASHAGWLEAGGANAPTYTGTRQTAVFAAASGGSISLSAGLAYTFTGTGTVQGAFLTLGSGAVATKDSTAGTLWSAGTFSVAQPVIATNVLTVSYSSAM